MERSERWSWSLKGEGRACGDVFLEREAVIRSLLLWFFMNETIMLSSIHLKVIFTINRVIVYIIKCPTIVTS